MSLELISLVVMAVLAVVAVICAVVAARAVRELRELKESPATLPELHAREILEPEIEPEPEVVEAQLITGERVIVLDEQRLALHRELSRPALRIAIVWSGVAHALRPESRDKITRIMRTEYKNRRRHRQRAARRAAAEAHQPPAQAPQTSREWISS